MPKYSKAGKPEAAIEAGMLEDLVNVLSSVVIDAKLDVPTVHKLFRVPAGKKAVIIELVAHSNSATLSGMVDVNLGGGAAGIAPVWLDEADLSSMTTAQMMLKLQPAGAVVVIDGDDATPANRTFVAEVVTGSTGDANVTLDVLGYLIDS
jgi:hypothetical protein